MSNAILLKKLKQKNLSKNTNFLKESNQSNINTITLEVDDNVIDPTIVSDKYNPDVKNNFNKIYDYTEHKRKAGTFTHTTNIWKPIIGSVTKTTITTKDLIIDFEKPDHKEIESKCQIEIDKRLEEKKTAEKMAKKYSEDHGLNIKSDQNLEIMNQINKPIDFENENNHHTFIELKKKADDTSKNISEDQLIIDMSKLDDLMNSIKNL
jgi:hypothetical protein